MKTEKWDAAELNYGSTRCKKKVESSNFKETEQLTNLSIWNLLSNEENVLKGLESQTWLMRELTLCKNDLQTKYLI